MIKFSKFITNKTVAILAVVIAVIEIIPEISTGITRSAVILSLLWILGAIFTWLKKSWAIMLLAGLSILYIFNDIILKIPEIREAISGSNLKIDPLAPYEPYIVMFSVILELVFMYCFLHYAIHALRSVK